MKRTHRLQTLAASFLLFELVTGYVGCFTPRHEIFPFSAWLMFALVPNRLTDYGLLLHGTAARPQEPPLPFDQSRGLVHAPHSIVSYQLIQQFGAAIEKGDFARGERLRPQIEEQFSVEHVRYDLIKVSYAPVARWKTGQVLSSQSLRSFEASTPPMQNPDLPPPLEREATDITPSSQTPDQP